MKTLFGFLEGMGRLKQIQLYSASYLRRLFALRKVPRETVEREVILIVRLERLSLREW